MNVSVDISGVILKTPRLILRPWQISDLDDFHHYAKVDGVGQMAGWKPHKSRQESLEILHSFISGRATFALEYEGRVIGSLGITGYSEEFYPELDALRGCELGYALSKEYWGHRLMPEAVAAVTGYLFDTSHLDFILIGYYEWNRQSARVVEKCGFRYIRTSPEETRYGTVEQCRYNILYRTEEG